MYIIRHIFYLPSFNSAPHGHSHKPMWGHKRHAAPHCAHQDLQEPLILYKKKEIPRGTMARKKRISRGTSEIIVNLWRKGYTTRYIVDSLAKVGVTVSLPVVRNHGRRGEELYRKRIVKPRKATRLVFTLYCMFMETRILYTHTHTHTHKACPEFTMLLLL